MPVLNRLQTAIEILKINSSQRTISALGYIENTLSNSLTKINKAIEIIKKPFTVEVLEDMISNKISLNEFKEINSNQKEDISVKYSDAITILNKYHHR